MCIAACQGRNLQIHAEDDQQNNCHSKGRDISKENGYRKQDLVKALLQVSSHSTQNITQQPSNDNGGQLQRYSPAHG